MKKLLFTTNIYVEWLCRILFTINIILAGLNYDDEHSYPGSVLLLTLIALWLYFFRLKIISVLPLVLAFFINYLHIGVGP